MYSSSADIIDILSNEMIRLVSHDESITASEKKLYELSASSDSIIVSEFLPDNTSYIKERVEKPFSIYFRGVNV